MHAFASAFEPIARITVATLFNSLWEAALLAFLVALILRLLPNLNATTRYAAWCVALIGSLLLPLATAFPQISVQHSVANSPHALAPAQEPAHTASKHRPSTAIAKLAGAPAQNQAPAAPAFKLPERVRLSLPEYVTLGLFAAWALAALLLLFRLVVNLWRLERLKSDALPLPVDYRERLAQWAAAEKGEREVRLCICDRIEVPVAVGLFDSMILIPQHLLQTLSAEEIDQIMLHELGHLRRGDDWTNGLQRLIQALFFFNPAILYISQQLDLEREVACDDWVVYQTKSIRPYATCLTKMAEVTAWPHHALAAPGVFVTRRGLSVRVERLLRAGRNIRTSISFGPAGAVVAALVVLFFVLQSVAPSFAFTAAGDVTAQTAESASHLKQNAAPVAKSKTARHQDVVNKVQKVTKTTIASANTSPAPQGTYITIPEIHVHQPARKVEIPAVNVDIHGRRLFIPRSPAIPKAGYNPLPPDFGAQIARQVQQGVHYGTISGAAAASAAAAGAVAVSNSSKSFNCVGCDFSGQNLAGRSFRGQKLSGTDFSRANLQNADFSNANLTGVDFSHANLRGANFSHANMNGCDLSHATLDGVNFDGVQMTGCDVDARSLTPTQARALIFACRNGCDFSGANLSGQDLRGLNITGVDLSGANLRNADLSNARINGVDFSGARLDGARFDGAQIVGCDLSGIDLSKVDLSNAILTGDRLRPPH